MGTGAADGSRGARRWLPWLGLCFWAAGAAAARGKRWVDGGARGERTEEERDSHLWRELSKLCLLLSARGARLGGNRVEELQGTTVFQSKFAICSNPTGCSDWGPYP